MKKIFFLTLLLSSLNVFAMGEDRPGPHGGMIRMPGSYHSEVLVGDNEIKVYLLDMGNKNPTVEKSSVQINLTQKSEADAKKVSCEAKKDYFACPLSVKSEHIAHLELISTRKGSKGSKVVYDFQDQKSMKKHH